MPAIVLSLSNIAILTRLTRAALLDVLGKDFVRVARAKGLSPRVVTRTHVLPNAAVPILTVLGLEAAHLMTGAAVVEYVFGWPGIGKMAVDAALVRDMPVVVGFAIAAGFIFVIANLIVDIAIAAFDPRVRSV
jgi:peptide/nickel transport system permease protein